MIDKDRLARAALLVAQDLGAREEWNDPAKILEGISDTLADAGVPHPSAGMNGAYWEHMSVDDALDGAVEGAGTSVNAYTTPEGITSVTLNIDASTATPEAIAAIFRGMRSLINAEHPLDHGAYFGRTADL